MPDILRARRTPWLAVAAVFFLNGGLFGAWASRIPVFVERFDLTADRLGLLLLCMAFGSILCFPLAGRMADRRGAAPLSLRLAFFSAVVVALLPFAPAVPLLAVGMVFFGAAQGGMDVAMNAWAAEVERHMGRPVMSSFHAVFSLGAGIGAGSGALAASAGLSPALHFPLVSLVLSGLVLAFATISWASARVEGGSVFALPRGALALVGLIALASALGEGSMADWSAVFLATVVGASEAQAALGYAVFSAAMVLARLAGDQVVRRLGPVTSARISGLLAAGGALTALLGGSFGVALAGFGLMGVGYAIVFPLAFSRAANDGEIPPGSAIASVATLAYGGMLVGPPAIGFIAAMTSLTHAFGLIAVLALAIVPLATSLRPAPRRARQEP